MAFHPAGTRQGPWKSCSHSPESLRGNPWRVTGKLPIQNRKLYFCPCFFPVSPFPQQWARVSQKAGRRQPASSLGRITERQSVERWGRRAGGGEDQTELGEVDGCVGEAGGKGQEGDRQGVAGSWAVGMNTDQASRHPWALKTRAT